MAVELTHKELVNYAAIWLGSSKQYEHRRLKAKWILTEWSGKREQPDVWGIGSFGTIMIECKASRTDFLADKKKEFRNDGTGCGKWRLYASNKSIIKPEDLPEGWGLIEPYGNGMKLIVTPQEEPFEAKGDNSIMWHMLKRLLWVGCQDLLEMDGKSAREYYRSISNRKIKNISEELIKTENALNKRIIEIQKKQERINELSLALWQLQEASKEEIKRLDALLRSHGIDPHTELIGDL